MSTVVQELKSLGKETDQTYSLLNPVMAEQHNTGIGMNCQKNIFVLCGQSAD